MDILYLSSLCTIKTYETMFQKYGSTSSHTSQKFHRLMVNGLVENGCHVDTLTQRIVPIKGGDTLSRKQEAEASVLFTYLPCKKGNICNRLNTLVSSYREIIRWHKKYPKGIVICDIILGEMSLAVWAAKRLHGIRTCAVVTDVPSIRAGETRTGIRAVPYKIKNTAIFAYDCYIFLTEQMNTVLNPNGRPYVVIEGIVDQSVLDKPNNLEGKYPEKVCIMAGLLEKYYGADDLLDAFSKVGCPDARLRFYGNGKSVQRIIEAAKKDNRIEYCGELTYQQIVLEEKKATLMINPRPAAGEWTAYSFPSKNMEYMASGTPMLAYRLPCIPDEYLPHFYYPENKETFGEKLKEVLSQDKTLLHTKGIEAQQWIVENKNEKNQMKKAAVMLQQEWKEL